MQEQSRPELYQAFIQFIRNDIQHERQLANRRMFNVFLWCFILPALTSVCFLLLIKFGLLPQKTRGYVDWLILVFPILYSLYVLSSEVFSQIPYALRNGGISTSLRHSLKEGAWRQRVCAALSSGFPRLGWSEWKWISECFQMDLKIMRNRTKFLTVFAGAVFFLLLKGIDLLDDSDVTSYFVKNPVVGWVEATSATIWQFVSLSIFLSMLYLSGDQTTQTLQRYLNCVELMKLAQDDDLSAGKKS